MFRAFSVVLSLSCSNNPLPRTPANPPDTGELRPQSLAHVPDEVLPAGGSGPASEVVEAPEPEFEAEPEPIPIEPLPLAAADEVAVWRAGEQLEIVARDQAEADGLYVLDVGTDWTPELFRSTAELPNDYAPVFVALANGRFDQSTPEGQRAAYERYMEPHGIPPSPLLLMRRFEQLSLKPCSSTGLSLESIRELQGTRWTDTTELRLSTQSAIDALQARLACEGHLRVDPSGQLDAETRAALEEFERRNRIYARGELRGPTLEALGRDPLELERATLVRVLTERMVLDLGVIEDSSACGALPEDDGEVVEDTPDMVQRLEQHVIEVFGLDSVGGLRRFYQRLKEGLSNPHYGIAIDAVELPEYHSGAMDLWVEIDRGDFYYDFPFHEDGTPRDFRIQKAPTLTLFARDGQGRARPLAQYRTTIGGWRIRQYGGREFWEYKESPAGARVWARLIAAPVWLPPRSTPPESLLITMRRTLDGSVYRELNRNLIGPGFASAYGLLATHHRRYGQSSDGDFELREDDGIRTHGSSDYTSIWRLSSSGCHRLHNHLALRLFSFILAHRSYERTGHRAIRYRVAVELDGFQDQHIVQRTGYGFDLERPIEVRVLPGRALGAEKRRSRERIPVDPTHAGTPLVSAAIEEPQADALDDRRRMCRPSAP